MQSFKVILKVVTSQRFVSYGLLAVALLVGYGWVYSWISGPDYLLSTIYRHKSAPVKLETSKVVRNAEKKTIEVPIKVISSLPAKQDKEIKKEFNFSTSDLHQQNKELLNVFDVPKCGDSGGKIATVLDKNTGEVEQTFKANPQKIFQIGGIREAGANINPIDKSLEVYYQQDVARIAFLVINARASETLPLGGTSRAQWRVSVGGAIRF